MLVDPIEILLVEDNPNDEELTSVCLEEEQYNQLHPGGTRWGGGIGISFLYWCLCKPPDK